MSLELQGGCHCGAVRYQLTWPMSADQQSPVVLPARRCSCSYCTAFRGTWTSNPDARLVFSPATGSHFGSYQFATATANFSFCRHCGVMVAALAEIEGSLRAVLAVQTLDQGQNIVLQQSSSCFDGENLQQRTGRRAQNWIGQVSLT